MRHRSTTMDQLRLKLSELNLFTDEPIAEIEKAIHLIRLTTIIIEDDIGQNDFTSKEEEIHFFRHTKPPLYALHIAHSNILQIESMRSMYGKKDFKLYIKQKLDFIKAHYIDYPEFTSYYNRTSSHDDERYFLRENRIKVDCFPHLYNESNSTGYDVVAAYLLAYKLLIDHYYGSGQKLQPELRNSNFYWSADKVAVVELFSGLKAVAAVNGGDVDLKSLCALAGVALNVEIKDIYGKRSEIKDRKGERCRFLKQMIDALEKEFDESDN